MIWRLNRFLDTNAALRFFSADLDPLRKPDGGDRLGRAVDCHSMLLDLIFALGAVLLVAAAIGSVYFLAATVAVRRFRSRPAPAALVRPPVTVLKPLHGLDPGLEANLLSFCDQDYPVYQIVCGVRDPDDSAIEVVKRVQALRPHVDLSLVVDPRVTGSNFKISNVENMMAEAKHDLLVLADSDIRVPAGYLASVAASLADPGVGLVTCLYFGRPEGGIWSRLVTMHINHGFVPSAIVADELGAGGGCFGATMALHRETLLAIGGFATLRDQLADDHRLGAAVRARGLRIALSPTIVANHLEEPDFAALWAHELRWARTIRSIAPASFGGSILTHGVVLAVMGTVLSGFSLVALAVLAGTVAARLFMVHSIDKSFGRPPPHWSLVLARDALSSAVFVASLFGKRVAWREHRFELASDGRLDPRTLRQSTP